MPWYVTLLIVFGPADSFIAQFAPLERRGRKPRAGGAPDSVLLLREANRLRKTLEKLVFWHLDDEVPGAEHWLLFVYDIGLESFTCYRSMTSTVSVDIWAETVIANFLTRRKDTVRLSVCSNEKL